MRNEDITKNFKIRNKKSRVYPIYQITVIVLIIAILTMFIMICISAYQMRNRVAYLENIVDDGQNRITYYQDIIENRQKYWLDRIEDNEWAVFYDMETGMRQYDIPLSDIPLKLDEGDIVELEFENGEIIYAGVCIQETTEAWKEIRELNKELLGY